MELFVLDSPLAILRFVLLLIVVAVAHEAGHMLAARLLGIPIVRVSIGLGPIIWKRAVSGERAFVLRAFPVGMSIGVPNRLDRDSRPRRPLAHDMLLAAGGPAANFLLFFGLAALAGLASFPPQILLWFQGAALLSVLLGLSNLLPLPGLDGGHLIILGATKLGFRLSRQAQGGLHRVGLCLTAAISACFVVAHIIGLI